MSAKGGRLILPRFRGGYTSRKLALCRLMAHFIVLFYNGRNPHLRVKARLLTGRRDPRGLASRSRLDGNSVSPEGFSKGPRQSGSS